MDKINTSITDYLNYLNSRPGATLIWKTPPHLYWIEITLILPKKSTPQTIQTQTSLFR